MTTDAELDIIRRLLAESRAELERLRAELEGRLWLRQCPTCGGGGYYPEPANPDPSGLCRHCLGAGHHPIPAGG